MHEEVLEGLWLISLIHLPSPRLCRMRVNGLKLQQGRFRLGISEKCFTKAVFKPWHRLPWVVVESPSLGVLKKHMCGTLGCGLEVNTVVLS